MKILLALAVCMLAGCSTIYPTCKDLQGEELESCQSFQKYNRELDRKASQARIKSCVDQGNIWICDSQYNMKSDCGCYERPFLLGESF